MSIRVIAGSAKGRQLKLVPGDTTRPIMDRVKESLFSIIGRGILDATFCDLYAGTGSVGIEALSRGASHTTFIDLEASAINTIKANLKLTRLEEKATIRRADALQLLTQPQLTPYDYLYIAPPQYKRLWIDTLELVEKAHGWLHAESSVIVQIDPTEQQDVPLTRLHLEDQRQYGSTLLLFYTVVEETTSEG
jgi:16S rRNA (guanine966-N2)-methyltransferase